MDKETYSIIKEIEDLRSKLYEVAKNKEMHDPAILQVSRQLDEKMNVYLKLRTQKTPSHKTEGKKV